MLIPYLYPTYMLLVFIKLPLLNVASCKHLGMQVQMKMSVLFFFQGCCHDNNKE